MLAPSVERFIENEMRNKALLSAARTAIAVERYRLTHDELPDHLSILVPQYLDHIPRDPFDSNDALRYKRLAKGYMVYSIGLDCTDDGGDSGNSRPSDGPWKAATDVTFTVER